jgi:hypothetical protein
MIYQADQLEVALRANLAIIENAQQLLTRYHAKQVEAPESLSIACSRSSTGRSSARRSGLCGKRWARISAITHDKPSGPRRRLNIAGMVKITISPEALLRGLSGV